MLNVISSRTVESNGTSVAGSKSIVAQQIATSVHTNAAWIVEFILSTVAGNDLNGRGTNGGRGGELAGGDFVREI